MAAAFVLLASDAARAPAQDAPLPRFRLREIVAGRGTNVLRIPGPWYRASQSDRNAVARYARLSARAGLTPLSGTALPADGPLRVLGLAHRAEVVAAARRTLISIRASCDDSTRIRLDRIFRVRGAWIVDLHDAALARARVRAPSLRWNDARAALTASGWLAPGARDTSDTSAAIPRALYRILVLAASDSAGFAGARAGLWRADSVSAIATLALLDAYGQSASWYAEAIDFLLTAAYLPGPGPRSLAGRVAALWRHDQEAGDSTANGALLPAIRLQLFGYPQAVPRYGVPPALFAQLVRAEDAEGRAWLLRAGPGGLLRMLHQLPELEAGPFVLETGRETFRLTSVARQARESLNGFLEPADAIALDPGSLPLLAVASVLHEWQHLIFERRRLTLVASAADSTAPFVSIPVTDPYLAEGLAEWRTAQVLAPLLDRWPLLGVGEAEKRVRLARGNPDDQHVLGYAMIRALASALGDDRRVVPALLQAPSRPDSIAQRPELVTAWRAERNTPDRLIAAPSRRFLVPQVIFSVEDGVPEVFEHRVLSPGDAGPP